MILYGVTGGPGMGKTAAAGFLAARGVLVIDTDAVARQVVEPGTDGLREVVAVFGSDVLDASGHLARAKLAERVFPNPEARIRLEAILHPRIREQWRRQVDGWRCEGRERAAVVIPLLFETSAETEFDRVICVACTAETQRERLRARGWTEAQISQRIEAQLAIGEKINRSDFVIWSEGSLESHGLQIDAILERRW